MMRPAKSHVCLVALFWFFFIGMALYQSAANLASRRVLVFARHGDRTPGTVPLEARDYWTAKLSPEKREKVDAGLQAVRSQLTSQGEADMVKLGHELVRMFPWISEVSKHRRKYYSTDYDRTKETTLLVQSAIEKIDYNSSSVDRIHFRPRKEDPLDPWESLPGFAERVAEFYATNETYLSEIARVAPLKEELINGPLNQYFTNATFTWIDAFDIMFCTREHATDAPNAEAILEKANDIEETVLRQFLLIYDDPELRRMAVGGVFSGMFNWVARKGTVSEHVFQVDLDDAFSFVGFHDTNLLPLKVALNWPETSNAWPRYGDYIAFEVSNNFRRVTAMDEKGRRITFSSNEFLRLCEREMLRS